MKTLWLIIGIMLLVLNILFGAVNITDALMGLRLPLSLIFGALNVTAIIVLSSLGIIAYNRL